MTHPSLFPAADPRVRWLRATLVASMMAGMLCCVPLWLSSREYPLVPLLPSWLLLPPACGPVLFGLVLFSLVAATCFFRTAIVFFLVATLYLYCCDQNRGQPWIYMYWVMLLLNLLPERVALAGCRLTFSVIYFWAGIQKLNGGFFGTVCPWFVQPAAIWGFPDALVSALRIGVLLTPLWEIFISLGVWFQKTRWFAVALAVFLHGAALLFLGPLGHNINKVIWPWNIAMVALLVVLFGLREGASLPGAWHELRRSGGAAVIVGLYGLLPILSFFGYWDSYFSFCLYSDSEAKNDFYMSQSFVKRLPARLQTFVFPVKDFDPKLQYQLPYVFKDNLWATAELGVPPLPEPRGYVVMFRYIAAYATNKNDCWILVGTRTGRILMYYPGISSPIIVHP